MEILNTLGWYLAPNQGQFSNDMFANHIFELIWMVTFCIIIVMLGIYYYVLNHALGTAKWANRTTYFIMMFITALIVALIATTQPTSMLYKIGVEYGIGVTWIYGLVTAIESAILFFALSYIVRLGSRNASHLPF
jgi:hypothetical protein